MDPDMMRKALYKAVDDRYLMHKLKGEGAEALRDGVSMIVKDKKIMGAIQQKTDSTPDIMKKALIEVVEDEALMQKLKKEGAEALKDGVSMLVEDDKIMAAIQRKVVAPIAAPLYVMSAPLYVFTAIYGFRALKLFGRRGR